VLLVHQLQSAGDINLFKLEFHMVVHVSENVVNSMLGLAGCNRDNSISGRGH
jgi:hypothetical protein